VALRFTTRLQPLGNLSGVAHIFDLVGATWQQQAFFTGSNFDQLGWSISVSGSLVVAGAFGDDGVASNSGAAYVYRKDLAGWVQDAKLKASDAQADDQYGFSVHNSGSWAVIGALSEDQGGFSAGAAYIYERNTCGIWVQRDKLVATDASASSLLGQSVQLGFRSSTSGVLRSYLTALTGAPGAGASGSGAAYWFEAEIPAFVSPCEKPEPL
jgi:hypothetical protein